MVTSRKKIQVKAPASTANLGSGFDSIGIAFNLYTEIEMIENSELHFTWVDDHNVGTPFPFSNDENLIYQAMKNVCDHLNKDVPNVHVAVSSTIPASRGLGSSASAFVAGLVGMNAWFDNVLSKDELLWFAAKREGHTDNVGASLFGGVFLGSINWEEKQVHYNTFPFPDQWRWLAAIPSYTSSTVSARNQLPDTYPKQDVVYNVSRYGLLVSSLLLADEKGIRTGLFDKLHTPYRQDNIPGFENLMQYQKELNALGFVISGAGPTILGLFHQQANLQEGRMFMEQSLQKESYEVDVIPLNVDHDGVQVYVTYKSNEQSELSFQSN